MKAVVKTQVGAGNTEIQERPEPSPGPGEVLVEVKVAGICGSDIHIAQGEFNDWLRPPVTIGHEFSGVVAELGKGVNDILPGDPVTAETTYSVCGRCPYCQSGNYNLCSQRQVLGYQVDGAFTRYIRVPRERLYPLPDSVDFAVGALTEPLSCAVHAVIEQTGVRAGDVVVVFGPGTIGQLAAQVAQAEGGRVMVVGTAGDEARLALARSLGAEWTARADADNVATQVMALTNGLGADVVVECSGAEAAAHMGFDVVRKRGKYTQVGIFGHTINMPFDMIWRKEIQVQGSASQKRSAWLRALALLRTGQVKPAPLVTDTFPITEWDAALATAIARNGVKVSLVPED
jgi:L-iditol 2-dehydrogenase